MTGRHPLAKLSAAVDGELDHDSRDRVFSHLVCCEACRVEVDRLRRFKARLAVIDRPDPPADLTRRLLAVPDRAGARPRSRSQPQPPATLRPPRREAPTAPPVGRPVDGTRTTGARTTGARPTRGRTTGARTTGARTGGARIAGAGAGGAAGRSRRAVVIAAAGSAIAVVSLLGMAAALGETASDVPLQPVVSEFSADSAGSTGDRSLRNPLAELTSFSHVGYPGLGHPSIVPLGGAGTRPGDAAATTGR